MPLRDRAYEVGAKIYESWSFYLLASSAFYLGVITVFLLRDPNADVGLLLFHLTYNRVAVVALCNVLFSAAGVALQAALKWCLGPLREVEVGSATEAAKTIAMDIILFLLLASPTIDGVQIYDAALFFALVVLLSWKLLHFIANARVAHIVEVGIGTNTGPFAMLLFSLFYLDWTAVKLFAATASFRSNFYLWFLFESLGMLLAATSALLRLAIAFVHSSLEDYPMNATPLTFLRFFTSRMRFPSLMARLRSFLTVTRGEESYFLTPPVPSNAPIHSNSHDLGSERAPLQQPVVVTDRTQDDIQCEGLPERPIGAMEPDDPGQEVDAGQTVGVGWPYKNEFVFALDLIRDLLELVLFVTFLTLFFLSNPTRLPIYLINDLFQVCRALHTRVQAFMKFRALNRRLETDFLNATLEEILEADTCIICRDLLVEGSKKLACSHILHTECLRSWFIHHQSCPTCRSDVMPPSPPASARATAARSGGRGSGTEASPDAAPRSRVRRLLGLRPRRPLVRFEAERPLHPRTAEHAWLEASRRVGFPGEVATVTSVVPAVRRRDEDKQTILPRPSSGSRGRERSMALLSGLNELLEEDRKVRADLLALQASERSKD